MSLNDYYNIVEDPVLNKLYRNVKRFYEKKIIHINSTFQGGGVAEMLATFISLMNDVGIEAEWRILWGDPDFFGITKKFHNALQGDTIHLTDMKKKLYEGMNERFSRYTLLDHSLVIIHDPQPLPLINFYVKRQPWIWRCHIDLSHPNKQLWHYLKRFILKYDVVIVSNENYKQEDLPIEQRVIQPAIDPLTTKNKDLSQKDIDKILEKFNIPRNKRLITQISRFDKWKDPEGVVDVFKIVRQKVKDVVLVLCGSMAFDDPEGVDIYRRVQKKAGSLLESRDVILLTVENNMLVNALQRVSSVIVQKSIREGFGLTVTEALWKAKPVVASNVGGIPLQIMDGVNGYTLDPDDTEGFAERIVYLFENDEVGQKFGENAKEYVRKNFLMTRKLLNYIELMNEIL